MKAFEKKLLHTLCVLHKIQTHSIVEITVFLYHTIDLTQNQEMPIQADGPSPLCSCLIYDPFRRYEVSQILMAHPVFPGFFEEKYRHFSSVQ